MDHRLAAILAADAVGYSRLMEADEEAAYRLLAERRTILETIISEFGGRVFGSAGDSVIADFPSSVAAVRSAHRIQTTLLELNERQSLDSRMEFRIGIHFGDMIEEGDDLFGEGVNLAARLESLAPPGGICLSGAIHDQVKGKIDFDFAKAGFQKVKNIARPLEVWCWPPDRANRLRLKGTLFKRSLAVGLIIATFSLIVGGWLFLRDENVLPNGPRIAVLPFDTLEDDPENQYFSDGLSKQIVSYLSKFSNLFVIDLNSTRQLGARPTCSQTRRELRADYILSGSVQRAGNLLAVTTSFTDAKNCQELDSPGPFRRDLSIASIFDIQLEIAQKVVAQVGSADAPLFDSRVANRLRREAPQSLKSYDCVLLSYWFYETFEPERLRRARDCLKETLKDDPDYSLGWSRLAFSYIEAKKYAIDTPSDWADLARQSANLALKINPENPDAFYALAILSQMQGEEHAVFRNFAKRAIDLNPNDAFVLADLGTWMAYSGEWEQGKDWVNRAKQLNPKHQSWWDYIWHLHAYLQGDYKAARDTALKVNLPDNFMVQTSLAAAYAMNGEPEKAAETIRHVLELQPESALDPLAPFRTRNMDPAIISALKKGLQKAGMTFPATKPDVK